VVRDVEIWSGQQTTYVSFFLGTQTIEPEPTTNKEGQSLREVVVYLMTPRIRQHRQSLREALNMIIATHDHLEFLPPNKSKMIDDNKEEGEEEDQFEPLRECHRGLELESYGCQGVKLSGAPPQSVQWQLRGEVAGGEYSYYSRLSIVMLKTNWYSGDAIQGYYREYLQLDSSENGMLSKEELLNLRWYVLINK
jgi:hypothetical protein